ncbi:TetR/AcrR family transcriptional regulator [Ohtaekwangia kribbensis]|jgi:AcrR family transcriptional regulator|uniref:TetR/AcrR family transcriptional regulator n=1 Tax=Ohtaekwangia kribbensis TaxID=688913 RepID=A0ABW3JWU8_9BACT
MEDSSTRDKILKGAEGLFTKYGVRSISMDDIARHLSVSKKTLYQHFTDKEDIVTLVFEAVLSESRKEFEAIHHTAENAIDELAKLSVCLKKNVDEINPSLLFDLQKYYPKAWAVWLEFKRMCIYDSIKRNLDQGIAEGFYRPEINTEIISIVRMALIETAFDDKTFSHDKFRMTEVQMQIFEHFVFGILTDKGRKQYLRCKEKNTPETVTR